MIKNQQRVPGVKAIGSREKPPAVISAEVTAGKVSDESAVYIHKVKHCDIRSLIPCKVFASFSIA